MIPYVAVSLDLLPDLPPALFPITKGAAEDDAELVAEAEEVTLPEPPSSRPFPTGRSPEGVGVAEGVVTLLGLTKPTDGGTRGVTVEVAEPTSVPWLVEVMGGGGDGVAGVPTDRPLPAEVDDAGVLGVLLETPDTVDVDESCRVSAGVLLLQAVGVPVRSTDSEAGADEEAVGERLWVREVDGVLVLLLDTAPDTVNDTVTVDDALGEGDVGADGEGEGEGEADQELEGDGDRDRDRDGPRVMDGLPLGLHERVAVTEALDAAELDAVLLLDVEAVDDGEMEGEGTHLVRQWR